MALAVPTIQIGLRARMGCPPDAVEPETSQLTKVLLRNQYQ